MRRVLTFLLVVLLGSVLGSCEFFPDTEAGGSLTEAGVEGSLHVTGNPEEAGYSPQQWSSQSEEPDTLHIELGDDTIVLEKVQIVLSEVELELDESETEDLEFGPYLLDLPLGGSIEPLTEDLVIPVGVYEEIEIEIEVETPDDFDDLDEREAFEAEYPEWDMAKSIRIQGTFNGIDFDESLDVDEDFEIELDDGLTVAEGDDFGIVLAIYVGSWFADADRDELIGPPPWDDFEELIEDTLEDYIEAFEDSLDD